MAIRLGARLTDPHRLVDPAKLEELNQKVSDCMTRLYKLPENGGNPFLFSLSAPKPHELAADAKLAARIKAEQGRDVPALMPVPTAATDGKQYYWHPDFIDLLLLDEIAIVMMHESFHVVFFHHDRMMTALARQRNWAMDYIVNACIETDFEKTRRKGKLWGGNLGKPIPLRELLDHIDGKIDAFPEPKMKPDGTLLEPEPRIFADKTMYGRSPESVYDEIMEHWEKSPRKCKDCGALTIDPKTKKPRPPGPCKGRPACAHGGMCCPGCGSPVDVGSGQGYGDGMPFPMDGHIKASVNKQEVQSDVMRAAQMTQSMRGTVPSEIEDYLGELMKPTLRFTDIVRSACMKKVQDAGLKNDWKRFRRRWISANPRQYLPKRHTHRPRWLAMLDTSGSMSDDDIIYGISQMQVLGNGTEGFVVPVDAAPHWDGVTPVREISDLKRTKVVGRGGTVFDEFFRDFPRELGTDFDCLVIITDGDCGTIPMELRPPVDVVWVLTRHKTNWKPSFGRVVPLRNEKM